MASMNNLWVFIQQYRLVLLSLIVFFIISVTYYWGFYRVAPQPSCDIYVYSYSSLTSAAGAGRDISSFFRETTGCQAHLENIGDARMLLQRLRSEIKIKGQVDADVVLGLDQFSVQEAHTILKWHTFPHYVIKMSDRLKQVGLSTENMIPFQTFIPFDWSPMTFIYRSSEGITPFKTLQEILTSSVMYALMDPRSSSPGFQFLVWIHDSFGKDMLSLLIKRALMISPSWTTAYGLFIKGQTQIAFSYLTSLAYHWIEEQDHNFQAMTLDTGHPYQIEFAGVVADSPRLDRAIEFVQFLHSREVQKSIMMKNYMFPIINGVEDSTLFADLPQLRLIPDYKLTQPAQHYLQAWKNATSFP